MRAQIFSFVQVSENSYVASVKLAAYLSRMLDVSVVDRRGQLYQGLDVLIIVNGAYAFVAESVREMIGRAVSSAGRVIWVQQDYTILPPRHDGGATSPFRLAFRDRHARGLAAVDFWTTCESFSRPGLTPSGHLAGDGSRYVNWNVLSVSHSTDRICVQDRTRRDSLLYYGAYRGLTTRNRKDRVPYFDRYFLRPHVRTVISSSSDKFGKYRGELTSVEPQLDLSELRHYGLGLYLEDRASHGEYHSPANRFYEMLSAGLGIVFQPEAMRTMSKAGHDVSSYVAWNAGEIPEMMVRATQISLEQRELWWRDATLARETLDSRLRTMWSEYVRCV